MAYTGNVWMNKTGDVGTQTFYCAAGDELEICHPLFCKGMETAKSTNEDLKALKGFRLIFPELGDITECVPKKWNGIRYHHKKSGQQIIEFTEDLGLRRSYLIVETVSPHDHGTIAQGGPAFATYYSGGPQEEH